MNERLSAVGQVIDQLSEKFSAEFTLLGNSALMLQLAYQLPGG